MEMVNKLLSSDSLRVLFEGHLDPFPTFSSQTDVQGTFTRLLRFFLLPLLFNDDWSSPQTCPESLILRYYVTFTFTYIRHTVYAFY